MAFLPGSFKDCLSSGLKCREYISMGRAGNSNIPVAIGASRNKIRRYETTHLGRNSGSTWIRRRSGGATFSTEQLRCGDGPSALHRQRCGGEQEVLDCAGRQTYQVRKY